MYVLYGHNSIMKYNDRLEIRLPEKIKLRAEKKALKKNMSLSDLIRSWIEKFLNERN